jgi:anti-sigma28 factor (negative regulator of flagellin synthesis)
METRKITSLSDQAAEQIRPTRVTGAPPSGSQRPADAPSNRVTMSVRACAFGDLRRAALAVPGVRLDRVDAVRKKLAAGVLDPDPWRIARALLERSIL